jgi:hypothetical protein
MNYRDRYFIYAPIFSKDTKEEKRGKAKILKVGGG